MKYLTQPTSGSASVPNPEWDTNTGKLFPNPEHALEGNSGAINYLNKFGDKSGYKTHDPAAELYYTAMRYLRTGSQGINSSVYKLNRTLTTDELDGFPAIYDWEDPLKSRFHCNQQRTYVSSQYNYLYWRYKYSRGYQFAQAESRRK